MIHLAQLADFKLLFPVDLVQQHSMTRHAPEMDLIATVHFSQPTNLKGQEAVLTKADSSFSW